MSVLGVVRLLLLEDNVVDAELATLTLRRFGFEPEAQRVETEADYAAALQRAEAVGLDLILADYALPRFDALRALQLLQATGLDLPFILVTGAIGEEAAAECIKQGATDYLLKDRLTRLGPAVAHALQAKKLRAQKRQAEEDFRQSQMRLQAIFAHAPIVVFAVDRDERLTLVEGKGLAVLGRPAGVGVGLTLSEAFRALPDVPGHVRRALAGETHTQIVALEGKIFETLYSPLRDGGDEITGMLGVAFDVTERQRALRVQSAIYRISEAVHAVQTLHDLFGSIHAVIAELMPAKNFYIALYDAATQTLTFPYYVDELDSVWPGEAVPLRRGLTEYVLRTGQPARVDSQRFHQLQIAGEVELIGPDSLDWVGVPLMTQSGVIGVLVVQSYAEGVRLTEADKDILVFVSNQVAMAIERKRAEARLRESEERFRVLAENIPGVIYLCRTNAPYTALYLNDEVERLTGYPKEDFLAGRINFLRLYHPDDAARIRTEGRATRSAGRPFHLIYRMYTRAGQLRWVEEWGTTVRVPEMGDELLEGFMSDITERHQAEEALRQAQKMESLGVLAGGVAHDFNNLLVAMLGQTSLALAHLALDHPARGSVEKAVKAAERAADLTRQLLAYSGRGQFAIRALQLNQLIQENLNLIAVSMPKLVRLEAQLDEALPLIEADAGQMQQVIMNLLINAAEAIGPRAGTVTVRTGVRDVFSVDERPWLYTHEPLLPGRYVRLEVQDDGIGMDAETLTSIFDPFFTTKFTGRGLGLAAVLGIVRGHRGGLQVESAVGQGTLFRLLFPASAAVPEPNPAPEPSAIEAPLPPKQVLVIDDEEPVRMAVSDILDMEGLTVVVAADGAEGLALYGAQQADIGLVVLDLSMPGLTGEETFQALRQINPEVRVILSSGYSQREAIRRFAGQRLAGFLQKPYDAEALIAEVWKHLR